MLFKLRIGRPGNNINPNLKLETLVTFQTQVMQS